MKRIVLVLLMCATLPIGAFASGFYLGADAYYAHMVTPADILALDPAGLDISDFAFGAEVRAVAGFLWGSAQGIYNPGGPTLPHRIDLFLDGGLALELAMVRVGVGIGPDFGIELGNNAIDPFVTGANLRIIADLLLGNVSLGLTWMSSIEFTYASIAEAFQNPWGVLGATLLFKM